MKTDHKLRKQFFYFAFLSISNKKRMLNWDKLSTLLGNK